MICNKEKQAWEMTKKEWEKPYKEELKQLKKEWKEASVLESKLFRCSIKFFITKRRKEIRSIFEVGKPEFPPVIERIIINAKRIKQRVSQRGEDYIKTKDYIYRKNIVLECINGGKSKGYVNYIPSEILEDYSGLKIEKL